jgi:hypothetical protein
MSKIDERIMQQPFRILVFVWIALTSVLSSSAIAGGLLDGKRFLGDAGIIGRKADEKGDIITFADGKFHSSSCDQYGYGKGDYSATRVGDVIQFEVTTTSEKDGRLLWKGTLKGDVLEGRFVHYRKPSFFRSNPEPVEHWFKASLNQ